MRAYLSAVGKGFCHTAAAKGASGELTTRWILIRTICAVSNIWLRPLPFTFSPQCLELLCEYCIYGEPTPEPPNKTFKSHLIVLKRHMGVVQAYATSNMSPVIKEYFAATHSMKIVQVSSGTNGDYAYVLKYV